MPPETAEVLALKGTIDFMKLVIYAEAGAIVAVCGFFIAWIRTLYDARITAQSEQMDERDKLLERVLLACQQLADALSLLTKQGGRT